MKEQKVMLELFSGSKTVSKFFESKGWKVITVDNNPKLAPSICCDILKLDYSLLPKKIDFIWASPDCACFSRATQIKHWDKFTTKYRIYDFQPKTYQALLAVEQLNKTVEIILKYPGANFVIENPVGRMQHFPAMKKLGHHRYGVNYNDYGFDYSKETYLFSNLMMSLSQKKVIKNTKSVNQVNGAYARSLVPVQLVEYIYKYLQVNLYKSI